MDITLRRLNINDAEVLTAIARKTFSDTFGYSCTNEDLEYFFNNIFNIDQHINELKNEQVFYYFAEVEGAPAGYIKFMEDYTSFEKIKQWKALELNRIYVLTEFQGKGVAQKLMEFILNYAVENNYEVVWLGVWDQNFKAQKFYEKYGFLNSGFDHPYPIGDTPQTDYWFWKFL